MALKKSIARQIIEDAHEAAERAALGWIDAPDGDSAAKRGQSMLEAFMDEIGPDSGDASTALMEKFADTLVGNLQAPVSASPAGPISMNVLSLNWSGSFDEKDLPDARVRIPVNAISEAFRGILAVATILRANDTERICIENADQLDDHVVYGLHDAMRFMSSEGSRIADDLGLALCSKGSAA